jgi:putative oxidoreductase
MKKLNHLISQIGNYAQPVFLLLIRLYFGYQIIESGWAHLHNVGKTAAFFSELGIPFPELNVYFSASVELVGGALILIGLLSRLISIPLIVNFIVAIVTVNWEYPKYRDMLLHPFSGDNFTDAILHDTAFPFLFIALLILLFGPGKISLDALISADKSASAN